MENKKQDTLVPDSRFQTMGKEALIVVVYWLAMFAGVMLSAVFLGGGDPAEYTYLFGFPLWYTVCIGIMIVGIVVGIFLVKKIFKDVSLDAGDPEFDYEKGEKK
ncbi:hypothetical protein CE91St43_20820 [Oscillospiraceae bacterium]|nr:hypothetical protein CE91St43_20820 [Oscillospiraceae bacterium]